jgi:hypothetical protein
VASTLSSPDSRPEIRTGCSSEEELQAQKLKKHKSATEKIKFGILDRPIFKD